MSVRLPKWLYVEYIAGQFDVDGRWPACLIVEDFAADCRNIRPLVPIALVITASIEEFGQVDNCLCRLLQTQSAEVVESFIIIQHVNDDLLTKVKQ